MTNFDLEQFYRVVDGMESEAFSKFFADDGEMVFANASPMKGRNAIAQLAQSIYEQIDKIAHDVLNAHQVENKIYCEGRVHYLKKSGAEVSLGFMTLMDLDPEGLLSSYRVYIDPTPFFQA